MKIIGNCLLLLATVLVFSSLAFSSYLLTYAQTFFIAGVAFGILGSLFSVFGAVGWQLSTSNSN
jgi:hypothetical protein